MHRIGDWRGSYIVDPENGRRVYLDSYSTQRRRWYKAAALAAARNTIRWGIPAAVSYGSRKFGFENPGSKRVALGKDSVAVNKKRKVSFRKGVGKSSKMVRRVRRVYKRRRSVSKRVFKKRSYRKRRRVVKSRRSMSSFKLRKMLAVPQTLKQAFSSFYEIPGGKAAYLIFDVTHSLWHNNQIALAAGQIGAFTDGNLGNEMLITKFLHRLNITSQNNSEIMLQVKEMYCKKDYKDADYAGSNAFEARAGQYNAPNAILQWAYQSAIALGNAGTDAQYSYAVADATNDRIPARVTVDSPQLGFLNAQFGCYFGVSKSYKTICLKPGETKSFSINDLKTRKLISHYHVQSSGNNTPQMFAGRSKFLLVKIWGQVAGTSEADVGGAENDKISTANAQVGVTWDNSITLRRLDPYHPQLDFSQYRPTILDNNLEFIGDNTEDPIAVQEV